MRLFTTLEEAQSEIKRDIFKSPVVISNRVQNLIYEAPLHEALDYSYSVADIPEEPAVIASLGFKWGFWKADQIGPMLSWMLVERQARLQWDPGVVTEQYHSHLKGLEQKAEPSYTYTDRLRGSLVATAKTLLDDYSTRRAFWPIFQPEDAIRSTRVVRIPCSIAYQALIRFVGEQPYLHLTYIERACDFNKFWLTDIWMARQWQLELLKLIRGGDEELKNLQCGNTTHFITSLHAFIDDEVY